MTRADALAGCRPADGYAASPRRGGHHEDLGGQVSDVVDAILFLESSPYITTEILRIDGADGVV